MAVGVAAWLAARGWGPEQESSFQRRQLASILRALQRPPPGCLLAATPACGAGPGRPWVRAALPVCAAAPA
eukprot:1479629-Alexandrium_andersonii.AAC.1